MAATHPKRRFEQVVIDIQSIIPKTRNGNTKVVLIIDVFTRYVRAVPVEDEQASTIASTLLREWISIFGPMERLIADRGPSLIGKIMENLTNQLEIKQLKEYPLHPQENCVVERWNRSLAKDLASFMSTGIEDWDEHVNLACFRYNTSECEATGISPFIAVFGVDAFEAWAEMDIDRESEDPAHLANSLAILHK